MPISVCNRQIPAVLTQVNCDEIFTNKCFDLAFFCSHGVPEFDLVYEISSFNISFCGRRLAGNLQRLYDKKRVDRRRGADAMV